MRVLVTGHRGYIGSIIVPMLEGAGYEVVGLGNHLFDGCKFGDPSASARLTRDYQSKKAISCKTRSELGEANDIRWTCFSYISKRISYCVYT